MDQHVRSLAETLWNYHRLNHRVERADAILVLCSYDRRVAEHGAELFLGKWAPLLIFSGGFGSITSKLWSEPEADQFAKIAIRMGVPPDKILIENSSSNTGENVVCTRRMLEENGLNPAKFILVQKPYMERRAFATFKQIWPEKEALVTSAQVSFTEYLDQYSNCELSPDDVVSVMVGDLQRIRLYPEKGYQVEQEIPQDVWDAFEELVRLGYNGHLIQ